MPGAANPSAFDTLLHTQKAKTTGSSLTRASCSEVAAAFFDCEDFWRPRFAGKATDLLLHHYLGFFDPFGYFHFLSPGQKWDLAHLLEIHPHRVVQNINLGFCSLLLFFVLVCVFLTVFVAIRRRRFNNVDRQTT